MDNVTDIPSVLGGIANGEDLRGDPLPGPPDIATLRELRITSLDQLTGIIAKYHSVDIPKESDLVFIHHLTTRRDAWFVEMEDLGLLYLTAITGGDASFHAVFWDQSLSRDRVAAARVVLGEAFYLFGLDRVSASMPHLLTPYHRYLRDIGFVLEGNTRRGWSIDPPIDLIHFGLLREECTWLSPR